MKREKKVWIVLLAFIIALLAIFVPLYITNDDVNLAFWRFIPTKLPQGFTITAHTGCEGTDANSMASLQAGYDSGANIVEFDLHFNVKGECVLAHDAPQEGETYMTLEEAFIFLAGKPSLQANLDVKVMDNMPFVYDLIEKYNLKSRVFFTGISIERVESIRKECPGVAYYLNTGDKPKTKEEAEQIAQTAVDAGALGINIHHSTITKKLVEVCHEKGLLVSVYTVDKTVTISHALLFAPDNITTRRPTQLKKVVTTRPR